MDLQGNMITDNIPVDISVRIGHRRMTVAELSAVRENDILPMDQPIDEGVEICVGEYVVAYGELVADEEDDTRLMVKITRTAADKP